jgi:hypothetical protein
MDIHVIGVGEWTHNLLIRMNNAVDGDLFSLPTPMHLHAFMLLKEGSFPNRDFKVEIKQAPEA